MSVQVDVTAYLLGVATPFVLALLVALVRQQLAWHARQWGGYRCGICGHAADSGPLRTARLRVHCRIKHGLALTIRARVRRRQWNGLTLHYALQSGCPSVDIWRAATAADTDGDS